jgi:tetratricopeptide (TPR) repeat protein
MKMRLLYIVALVFLAAFSKTGWAPVGPTTVPPSSRRSGLIRSPNPIDRSGNLVITGNVGGGKHFRGVVPYNAVSDFGGRLGSSPLDSFLRRSVTPRSPGRYTGRYEPYYSQTGTVTTTSPGLPGVIRPPTTTVTARPLLSDTIGTLPPLSPRRAEMSYAKAALPLRRLRPMSMTPQQLEKVISAEVATFAGDEKLTAEWHQTRTEQLQQDLKQVSDKAAELEKIPTGRYDSLTLPAAKKPGEYVPQRFETPTTKEQAGKKSTQTPFTALGLPAEKLDVYEQMKQQLGFEKRLRPSTIVQQTKEPAEGEEEPTEEEDKESSQEQGPPLDELSGVRLSARAKTIMGSYETFASFSKDKFNQYLSAAEQYLKQGKYYRAADTYTLASIYKPDDPLVYAGKSHALFAAGEYMSSALFLSRALEIFPEYAQLKIDLEAMVGDIDKLETRVADVEQWLERSGAVELQFLLAYVHYQMDRPQRAKEAIDAAYEKMPEAPPVITLKKAIYEHINGEPRP